MHLLDGADQVAGQVIRRHRAVEVLRRFLVIVRHIVSGGVGGARILDGGCAGLDLAQISVELRLDLGFLFVVHFGRIAVFVGRRQAHARVIKIRVVFLKVRAHIVFRHGLFAAVVVDRREYLHDHVLPLRIGELKRAFLNVHAVENGAVLLDPCVVGSLLDLVLLLACKREALFLHVFFENHKLRNRLFGAVFNPRKRVRIVNLGFLHIVVVGLSAGLAVGLVQFIDVRARRDCRRFGFCHPRCIAADRAAGQRRGGYRAGQNPCEPCFPFLHIA